MIDSNSKSFNSFEMDKQFRSIVDVQKKFP